MRDAGKTDIKISKGFGNPKRKLGGTTHFYFLEIPGVIKQQLF